MQSTKHFDSLPAILSATQTAQLLGLAGHDIPILIAAKLLVPLGKPTHNAPKCFARVEILLLADDLKWLNKAKTTVSKHWEKKNEQQRTKREKHRQQDYQQTVQQNTPE